MALGSMALDSSVGIVGYIALFAGVGLVFVFVNLLVGRFLRPSNPHEEKLEIYECGEPSIGSSFVQFDLRFYVVALVFIIFDVEVAFLFPWATVFGKVTNLRNDSSTAALVEADDEGLRLTPAVAGAYRELGAVGSDGRLGVSEDKLINGQLSDKPAISVFGKQAMQLEFAGLKHLVGLSVGAVLVFFVVLLVGFAYEWRTGALDWVRAVGKSATTSPAEPMTLPRGAPQESVLST